MKNYKHILIVLFLILAWGACKNDDNIHPNPYGGGKQPLGISFSFDTLPSPSHGMPGDEIVYTVHGLGKYDLSELTLYLHHEEAEIKEVTDSTITIVVPQHASTGEAMLYVKGQVFFGPVFNVDGKVSLDETFKVGIGANRIVNDFVEKQNTNLLFVGGFTDFDLRAVNGSINRIVMTTNDGEFLPTLLSGEGANGVINSIVELPNGQFMIGGSFTSFNEHDGINRLTRLNSNGSLDSMIVDVVAMPDEPGQDTVPAFNGGVSGSVVEMFVQNNKVVAVGNFTSYGRYFYETSTYETKILDETKINQLVRMEKNGEMDSSFNYNRVAEEPYSGGNGRINDAVMLENGSIVVVGSFTKYNELDVGGIVKIGASDGLPVSAFNAGGSGADDDVTTINFNENTEKYVLTGLFHQFNGEDYNGLVMLNEEGAIDSHFQLKPVEGGRINFASQLDNGLIIVSGSFRKYNGVTRNGFMILNPDGTLAEGYNNTGDFQGQIRKIYETQSALGRPAVILAGYIERFDGQKVNNILRIEIQP